MATKPAAIANDPRTLREAELLRQLDPAKLPRHVGIIMDGNGRWARQRGIFERIRGHEAGIAAVRIATRTAGELGLKTLSLYAFSKENWNRPKPEINALMALLEKFLIDEIDELNENNVRLVACGNLADLPDACRRALERTLRATEANSGLTLNLALSYGGRSEIVDAARQLAREARAGILDPERIDEELFNSRMYRPELGHPDLIIRTSGEFRVSNFMIWQTAYSEFFITPTLWPDFSRALFLEALADYQNRERRFGGV